MPRAEITLPRNLRDALRRGHPWVYRNHLDAAIDLADGTEVVVRCAGWRGIGLWDAQGPIAIRIYTTANRIDATLITQRVREAWQGRSILRAQGVTAYRWLFGEGDGLPGITVDLYGNVAVLQSYGSGPASIVHHVVAAPDPTSNPSADQASAAEERQGAGGALQSGHHCIRGRCRRHSRRLPGAGGEAVLHEAQEL
jgi:23S rRNA (cytosine1962-C5)-methyltransferase